jgi:hypothetical protein
MLPAQLAIIVVEKKTEEKNSCEKRDYHVTRRAEGGLCLGKLRWEKKNNA